MGLRFISSIFAFVAPMVVAGADANRLTYLDETDPFYVQVNFPKLTAPQWVGEPGVEGVVILAVDDMREPGPYEALLRPILTRLKKVDGRAPVSILCNTLDPKNPQYAAWVKEGLSLEVHTLTHPCPILARTNFQAAAATFFDSVSLLNQVPGNRPCAFRTPCCDSINSASPRLFAELFNRTNAAGQFLTIDSSVMNIPSTNDPALPPGLVTDANGQGKFDKYVPFSSFTTTIENYAYPYVIGRLCWEFPATCPSDWEASHLHGNTNPVTVADWKAAVDATLLKQGTFTMIFHPHGWISSAQMVDLVDYALGKYGAKIKFLNFREAQDRLDANLLAGEPLRAADGQDNGVRLLDLNGDGYLDVVIGNERARKTRIWNAKQNAWIETSFPTGIVTVDPKGGAHEAGVRFGVISSDGLPIMLVQNETTAGAWRFDGRGWVEERTLLRGLELDGQPLFTCYQGRDRGVRLRDVDKDGLCELIVGNESQNAIFSWSADDKRWKKLPYGLPRTAGIVNAEGGDNGLRFVDINGDGFEDVVFSNAKMFSLNLFIPEPVLGWATGWTREVTSGQRGEVGEIPMIVREGEHRNNGAWFHSKTMWVQNEDTATLPGLVEQRTFKELVAGQLTLAKSPRESLRAMKARPGFKVELVASEPLVESPVAFDWGADGRLWVVEMGDYPLGTDGKGKAGGIVRFLEDTNGGGHYNKSTVFLEGLNFPNGIIPWRKGVIVSAPPEVFYAEDTDGDGKADTHKTLFTGFREGNQQHRANGFDYGLDNWLYGANGESGGTVRSVITGKSFDIGGRDFRFRPDDGAFETQAGQTQFGRHRDDWGNWFGNNNASGSWHYFLPEQYLRRNPYVAARATHQTMPDYADYGRVFPISRLAQRFNDPFGANHLTSANSTTPYRDDLFGPQFASSCFVSEPVHNLVHREVLEPDGVSFTSHRAADEKETEFLASTDNWFRPTMTKTGPDGALYVADMYRQIIEHPEWIPEDFQKSVNLRAGENMGRIYRVYPENVTLRPIPRLDKLVAADLAAAMESPNGWQRDTVQRLLVGSGDKSAIVPLQKLVTRSPNPKTRLQALCTLDGLHALNSEILIKGLHDEHPSVRENAVRICESFFRPPNQPLQEALLALAGDPEPRVRYQLAFTLGELRTPEAGRALARIAAANNVDDRLQLAIKTSAPHHLETMISSLTEALEKNPAIRQSSEGRGAGTELFADLMSLSASLADQHATITGLRAISEIQSSSTGPWRFAGLSGFLEGLSRRKQTLTEFQASSRGELKKVCEQLEGIFVAARGIAADSAAKEPERIMAIRLLGGGATAQQADFKELRDLLGPQHSPAIRSAALANLKTARGKDVSEILISVWKNSGPASREEIVALLLSRSEWVRSLLAAMEAGQIAPTAFGAAQRQKVLTHPDAQIRNQAEKLFTAANSDRKAVLKQYEVVNQLKADPARGANYFRQNCVPCHRFRNEGNELGADLGSVASKPVDYLIASILDPNQTVEARYVSFTATTRNDLEYTGIVTTETPNSITLRQAGGKDITLLRSELKDLTGSGHSLMPDGFENALNPQALADLIAYIRGE